MNQTPDREATVTAARPAPVTAVLYVCAARGTVVPGLAAERAETEGRVRRGLRPAPHRGDHGRVRGA